jgi:hypothetical protein
LRKTWRRFGDRDQNFVEAIINGPAGLERISDEEAEELSRPAPENDKKHRTEVTEGTEDVLNQAVSILLPEFKSYQPGPGSGANVKRSSGQNESIKAIPS